MDEPNPVVIADRYEVVGTLGEGGMGVVYKARDRLLENDVALKMMREMDNATTSKIRSGVGSSMRRSSEVPFQTFANSCVIQPRVMPTRIAFWGFAFLRKQLCVSA